MTLQLQQKLQLEVSIWHQSLRRNRFKNRLITIVGLYIVCVYNSHNNNMSVGCCQFQEKR